MNIYFRHGPVDGKVVFSALQSDTVAVPFGEALYHYRRTNRRTADGAVIFQCLGVFSPPKRKSA